MTADADAACAPARAVAAVAPVADAVDAAGGDLVGASPLLVAVVHSAAAAG